MLLAHGMQIQGSPERSQVVTWGRLLPVVSTCSRCSTAWIKASVPTAWPAARCKAARAAPARMLLVPAGHRTGQCHEQPLSNAVLPHLPLLDRGQGTGSTGKAGIS